jgi:hypothetical protein
MACLSVALTVLLVEGISPLPGSLTACAALSHNGPTRHVPVRTRAWGLGLSAFNHIGQVTSSSRARWRENRTTDGGRAFQILLHPFG